MSEITIGDFSMPLMTWGRKFPTVSEIVDFSQRVEKLGYYSVGLAWLPALTDDYGQGDGIIGGWPLIMDDHPGHCLESLAVLPMIAQATSALRLGLNALMLPALHPFYVAKYLATLDVASGGRVTTVFGFGIPEADGTSRLLEWLGSNVPTNRRGRAAEEALEVITRLWTESEPLDHEGEFFRGKQMLVEPKPVQNPYPEIVWAGERKGAIKLAARYGKYLELQGEAVVLWGYRPLERIREFYAPSLADANERWGGSAKLSILIGARVTEKPLTPAELAKLYWFEDRPDSAFPEVLPAGSPEQCAEVILALREVGIDHFLVDFSHEGYESLSFAIEQAEAWTTDVMPLLSRATVTA